MRGDLARELRYSLTDIPALLDALGMGCRREGSGYKTLCPVHKERTPSCSVRIARDGTVACRCHGCGWSADALGLVAVAHCLDRRRDFREILRTAARIGGRWDLLEAADGCSRSAPIMHCAPRVVPAPRGVDPAAYHAIATALLELCELDSAPDVAAYLEARAIGDEAAAAGVRALPRDQRSLVASMLAAFPREALVSAGVLRAGRDAIDWGASHRLLLPWRDADGHVVAIQRRRLDDGRPKYVFPPDVAPMDPFGCELLTGEEREIIVTEGALDALARRKLARMRGEDAAVVAIPSATTIRPDWSRYFAGRDVVIAFDADEAGDRAAERFALEVCAAARSVIRERPQGAKDINEVLLQEVA